VIKNIIFDLGVVIIDILDESIWYENHLIPLIGLEALERAIQTELFLALETGEISVHEFWQTMQLYAKRVFTLESLEQAWNARLKTISTAKMEQLILLSKSYPLWLLSNTNQIHLDWIKNYIIETFHQPLFDEIFKKQYYSYLLKMKKPERTIYEFVIQDAAFVPNETIFIEDTLANLKEPAALGIHTIHYQNEDQFQKTLEQLLQL